jgi:hypothetical protein
MQMLPVIPQAEIAPSIGKTGSGEVSGTGNFSPFLQVATEHEGKKVPSTEEELIAALFPAVPGATLDSVGMQETLAGIREFSGPAIVVSSAQMLSENKAESLPLTESFGAEGKNMVGLSANFLPDHEAVSQQVGGTISPKEAWNSSRSMTSTMAEFAQGKDGGTIGYVEQGKLPVQADPFMAELMQGKKTEDVSLPAKENNVATAAMDPRFAKLLGSQADQSTKVVPNVASLSQGNPLSDIVASMPTVESPVQKTAEQFANQFSPGNGESGSGSNAFSAKAESFGNPSPTAAPGEGIFTVDGGRSQNASPVLSANQHDANLRLPSGTIVTESQVVDQVVERLSINPRNETSSLTVKMHPVELGELKLELVVERDTVRAHLVAQTQQVQDVLERHMPRLREALELQGLKLDDIQVSIDSQKDGGKGFFHEHHAPSTPYHATARMKADQASEMASEQTAGMGNQAKGGLSLRI